ncbi:hypothetical protein ACQJBY_065368 [Aegilops geniculata]
MALAPRSSLRSLVLLMSHGRPRLSSFFSSAADATGVPPAAAGADAAPAVQPPAPPGPSCPKLPVEEEFVLDPTPGYGSCSTADEPPCGASEDVKQRDVDPPPPAREGVGHRVVDPPRGGRGRRAVPDEPEQCTQEHPKYPVPDSSSDKVCSSAVPPPAPGPCTPAAPDVQPPVTPALPDRSGHRLPDHEESVFNPLPDPPSGHRLSPVIEEPARCTLDNPKYPTPDHGSCSPSEGASADLLEDPLHRVPDPPRRP